MSERDPSRKDYMAAWTGKLDTKATQELSSPEQESLKRLASTIKKIIKNNAPLDDLGIDSSNPFCNENNMPEDAPVTFLPFHTRPNPNTELGITAFIFDENDKIDGNNFCLSIIKFAEEPVYENGEPKGEFDEEDQTWIIKNEAYLLRETDSGWTISGRELWMMLI